VDLGGYKKKGACMRESYKDYVIGTIQESENSWTAKVTRKDGALIRLKYGDGPVSSITAGARLARRML
jgi:hypothetical protein